jgi:hypothetical protein
MNIDTQALIGELGHLFERIRNGSAGRGDLEAFAAGASELYERAIVLRYKAYEQQVFGTQQQAPPASAPEAQEEKAPVQQGEPVSEEIVTTEAMLESNDQDISIPVPADPEPIKEPEGFDLFSLNDEEETDDEPAFTPFAEDKHEEPAQPKQENSFTPPNDMPDFDEADKDEVANPDPVIGTPTMTADSGSQASPEDKPVFAAAGRQPELPADELKPRTIEQTEHHPLYNRLHAGEDTLAARLLSVKLDTLNGAFGFNERMQIVQELFHGSNDAFGEAVQQLDNLSSRNEARSLVTRLANQYNWSDRSDLVMDFVKKVERRYA